MKLAPAIEEFVRYKQALGNSYTTPLAWKQQLRISHGLPSRRQPCAIREAVLRHIEDTRRE
jgi:hypothetical protein